MRAIVRKTTVDSRSRELPYALFVTVLYKCAKVGAPLLRPAVEYAIHMFLRLENYVELLWEGIVEGAGSREERKRKKIRWTSTANAF